jgi:P4 family phage/plasmid primase-like protien
VAALADNLAALDSRDALIRAYLERGWALFVLGESKRPLPLCDACRNPPPGHDPETCGCLTCHGFYAATTDPSRLELMLATYPTGKLGLRTGAASGVLVLDAEADADGDDPSGLSVLDAWEQWVDDATLPDTLAATTAGGGVHLFLKHVDGAVSRNRVLPGLDVKAEGGYVVLPDAIDDRRRWLDGASEVAEPDDALAAWLRMRGARTYQQRGRAGGGWTGGRPTGYDYRTFASGGCPGGHRDVFFNELAFRVRKEGVDRGEAEQIARTHWERCEQPPVARWFMPWRHVIYKLDRVYATVAPDADVSAADAAWASGLGLAAPVMADPAVAVHEQLLVREPERNETASDRGNADRFVRLQGADVRYLTATRSWLIWHDGRWQRDELNSVLHRARCVPDDCRRQSEREQLEGNSEAARGWAQHALRSESARSLQALVTLAAADPRIALRAEIADADPWLLAVRNGALDLRTGKLRAAERQDHLTRCADVVYDPDALAPLWRGHVEFITQGSEELAAYLRRAVGYTLTGLVSEQAFFLLEGNGANGKSAFIEPIRMLLGDYAQASSSALLTGGDEQHPTILADLHGARLVHVDEPRQGRPLNAERVKALTGSREVRARRMGRDFFSFAPTLKLWISGNTHPAVRDSSDGIWRRMQRVPFLAKVAPEQRVLGFEEQLFEREAAGILNWALEGLADWRDRLVSFGFSSDVAGSGGGQGGLGAGALAPTHDVSDAVAAARAEEDWVGQFVEETCHVGEACSATVAELYAEYQLWCALAGVPKAAVVHRVEFGRELGSRGYSAWRRRVDGQVCRGYDGIAVGRSSGA